MLELKLIHASKRGPWNMPAPASVAVIFKGLFILSTCILVCLNEHRYSFAPGYSVSYPTAMQVVVTVAVSLYWMG